MRTYCLSATNNAILYEDHKGIQALAAGALHAPEAQELIRRGNAHEELVSALRAARDVLYNGFKSDDKQSHTYTAISAILEKHDVNGTGPANQSAAAGRKGSDRQEAQQL